MLKLSQESDWKGIFNQDSSDKEKDHEKERFKATLPNGVTVRIVGICKDPNKEGQRWWLPNGIAMEEPEYEPWDERSFKYPAFGYLLKFSPHAK